MRKFICPLILALWVNVLYSQDTIKVYLSLEGAIESALKNNPEIKRSAASIDGARGRFWNSISLPQPTVTASYDFVPKNQPLARYEERAYQISQPFEFPTNYYLYGKQASSEIDITKAELFQTSSAIILKVKDAYYKSLAAQALHNIALENMQAAQEFMSKAQVRYNAGEAANIELMTARLQNAESANAAAISLNELKSAREKIKALLAEKNVYTNYILTDSLKPAEVSTEINEILEKAFGSNPLIKKGEAELRASSARRQIAWSGLLPSFEISYSWQALGGSADYYGVSFGMSLPLWFMFDQKGKIQEASAGYRGAEAELIAVKNTLRFNITNAYINLKNEERQLKLYKDELLPQANEIYRAALLSYGAGELSYIELLQAKQTANSVKSNYVNALLNYNIAAAQLEQLAGSSIYNAKNME
jgi:outer membrane protein TolC